MEWLSASNDTNTFDSFSLSHLIVIFISFVFPAILFLNKGRLQQLDFRKMEIIVALSLLVSELSFQFWMIYNGTWTAAHSIPLELCSISLFLSAALLVTRKRALYEIVLFTSLLGASQAILTPVLTYDFPHFRFIHFFYTHLILIWVPFYFTWILGYRPTLWSVLKVFIFLNTLMPVVISFNKLVKGNYMFLSHKPDNPSLLDLLGPYPWYILSLEGLLLLMSVLVWILFRERTAEGMFPVNKEEN
ncbi:YwaF family protein [Peribacillus deserti]|uniref:TIGR02206 family membrane protein n=1 Tax=Peribacillus deserti TaxID=673318 RepID=A0A2N5M7Z6_9BACI|nr:TIGR02206 family membrane protein [Peribacillus deserti]PLT30481.1 TIGR02206 family membrane protein [Peribacillus deserti]